MAERARRSALALLMLIIVVCASTAWAAPNSSGTVVRVGSDYKIPPGARHTGNVIVFGGNVSVAGELEGRAVAVGGAVVVSGSVNGQVVALGGRAVLQENAKIAGSVTAIGGGVERANNVDIRGEVNNISLTQGLRVPEFRLFPFSLRSFPIYALYLLGLYMSALILAYLFSDQVSVIENHFVAQPGRSSLVGLAAVVLMAPLSVVLALSVVGLPLVLLAWLAMLIAKEFGYVALVGVAGKTITGKLAKRVPKPLTLAIGVVVLGFLRSVPFVGFLFGLLILIGGLGAALLCRFGIGGNWWPRAQQSTPPTPPTP